MPSAPPEPGFFSSPLCMAHRCSPIAFFLLRAKFLVRTLQIFSFYFGMSGVCTQLLAERGVGH